MCCGDGNTQYEKNLKAKDLLVLKNPKYMHPELSLSPKSENLSFPYTKLVRCLSPGKVSSVG